MLNNRNTRGRSTRGDGSRAATSLSKSMSRATGFSFRFSPSSRRTQTKSNARPKTSAGTFSNVDSEPLIEGNIYVSINGRAAWRQRYCKVYEDRLVIHKAASPTSGVQVQWEFAIDQFVQNVVVSSQLKGRQFAFTLSNFKEKHMFSMDSKPDTDRWMHQMGENISNFSSYVIRQKKPYPKQLSMASDVKKKSSNTDIENDTLEVLDKDIRSSVGRLSNFEELDLELGTSIILKQSRKNSPNSSKQVSTSKKRIQQDAADINLEFGSLEVQKKDRDVRGPSEANISMQSPRSSASPASTFFEPKVSIAIHHQKTLPTATHTDYVEIKKSQRDPNTAREKPNDHLSIEDNLFANNIVGKHKSQKSDHQQIRISQRLQSLFESSRELPEPPHFDQNDAASKEEVHFNFERDNETDDDNHSIEVPPVEGLGAILPPSLPPKNSARTVAKSIKKSPTNSTRSSLPFENKDSENDDVTRHDILNDSFNTVAVADIGRLKPLSEAEPHAELEFDLTSNHGAGSSVRSIKPKTDGDRSFQLKSLPGYHVPVERSTTQFMKKQKSVGANSLHSKDSHKKLGVHASQRLGFDFLRRVFSKGSNRRETSLTTIGLNKSRSRVHNVRAGSHETIQTISNQSHSNQHEVTFFDTDLNGSGSFAGNDSKNNQSFAPKIISPGRNVTFKDPAFKKQIFDGVPELHEDDMERDELADRKKDTKSKVHRQVTFFQSKIDAHRAQRISQFYGPSGKTIRNMSSKVRRKTPLPKDSTERRRLRDPISKIKKVESKSSNAFSYLYRPRQVVSQAYTSETEQFVEKEVDKLIEKIADLAHVDDDDEQQRVYVEFGHLFKEYAKVSDYLVGLLMKAKKTKRIEYNGWMLYKGTHDRVKIYLPNSYFEQEPHEHPMVSSPPLSFPTPDLNRELPESL